MENPMSWTDTQKLINKAIGRAESTLEERASNICDALLDEELAAEWVNETFLYSAVHTALIKHRDSFDRGICGLSDVSTVYHALVDGGFIRNV